MNVYLVCWRWRVNRLILVCSQLPISEVLGRMKCVHNDRNVKPWKMIWLKKFNSKYVMTVVS